MNTLCKWIVLTTFFTSAALATDGIWTNTAGGNWGSTGNWLGGTIGTGTDAVADFSTLNITGNPTVTLDSARTVGRILFGDTTPSNNWALSGANTLTLDVSAGAPVIHVANQTATINTIVATSDGFTKTGAGTLVFTGNNTAITGTVTISSGQLTLSGSGRLNAEFGPQSGQPTLAIESGGSVLLDSSGTSFNDRIPSHNLTTLRGGELKIISHSTGTFETVNLSFGTGFSTISLDANPAHGLTLFVDSIPTRSVGATALLRGDNLGGDASAGTAQIKTQLVSTIPTLSSGPTGGGSGTSVGIIPYMIGDATLGGTGADFVTYIQTSSGNSSQDGYKPLVGTNYVPIFADGVNIKLSAAASTDSRTVLALALTNAGTGTVATINAGQTLLISSGAILSAGSVANTISGGSLTFGVNAVTSREAIFHVVTGLTVNSAIVDQSGNAVKLVKSSGGTLLLGGSNSYSGGTWINAGTLQVGSDGNLGNAAGAITMTGGTLNTTGTFSTARGITLNAGTNTFNINAGTTLTANGSIGGAGGLTLATGTGTLVLGTSNSFSGGVTLNAGTLSISADSNLGTGSGVVTIAGGTLNPTASFATNRAIALNAGTNNFNVGSGVNFVAQGTVSGTGGLTKATGTGTLSLTGTNTYSGGTFLNAGTLSISSNAALGAIPGVAATNLTFGGNAALQLTSGAGSVALSATRNIAIGNTFTGTFDTNGAGNTLAVGGVISGTTANLLKTGAGTLTVGAANTYTGTTNISQGTLSASDVTVAAGISSLGNATSAVLIGGASTAGTLLYTGANDTMTRAITLGAGSGTINVNTGATTLIVSGKVSGGALGKDGAGTLTLSNATNDFTGATTVVAGTLKAGVVTTAFGNLSAVTVNSGATLDLASLSQTIGSLAGAGNVTIGAAGTFLTAGGNNTSTSFSGNLTGGGGLMKSGSGVLTLSGNNNYSGSTTVNGGTLRAGSATGFTPNNTFTLAAGTTLDLNDNNVSINALSSGASTSAVTLGSATLSITGGSFLNFAGAISGTGGLTLGGVGRLTLTGTSNTYSGATLVNTTTASTGLGANATNALSSASAHTVNSGSTIFLNNFNNAVGSLAGSGTVTLGSGTLTTGGDHTSTTFSGAIGGTGGVTKVGSGTFTLSSGNGYSGSTIVNGGTLSIANNGNIGSGALALGGGTLNTTASMVLSRATTLNAGTNSFNVNSGTTLEITGPINGGGGLTVAGGAGTLILTGTKGFGGGVTINSGVLQVAADDSLGSAGAALAFGGGTLNSTAAFTSNRPITLNAGTNTFDVNNSTTLTEQGAIGGTGGFVKQGSGTLILSGGNNYSGATAVSAGILQVGSSTALGSNSALTVNATLDLDNHSVTVGSLAGSGTVTLGSAVLTAGGNNTTTTFLGSLGGSGALIKTGSGVLTLGGTNNYAGTTTITGGTLAVGADQNLGGGDLGIGSGATFASTGTFATSRTTELTGGQGTIEVVGSPTTLTLNTGIIGAGSLFKSGTGTLALAGASSYLGNTTIGAGTLSLITGGSIASNQVTVNSPGTFDVTVGGYTVSTGKTLLNNGIVNGSLNVNGGTISGSGTFNGELTIANSSVISPGNSPGTMNTAAQTWAGAGIYQWEIDQASRTLGVGKGVDTGHDWVNISGALSVSSSSGNPFVIDITGLSHASHTMGAVAGFDEARAYEWTLATASAGISGFDASKFSLNATNFTNNNTLGTAGAFSISTAGNEVRLVFTPGPNESTLFFGATPGTINNATSTTNASADFGRVMQSSVQTTNVALNRVGVSTDYTVTSTGDASSTTTTPTAFDKPSASHDINVTLNTASTGARSGSLTIDNIAATSAAAGRGTADGDDTITVSGTVLANRDIAQSGAPVNLGKAFVGLNTTGGTATLSGGAPDDNNATRVDLDAGNAAAGGVTLTYASGADNRFDSASETKNLSVVGNFAVSGSKSGSVNAASLFSNGEAGAVGATLDASAPVSYLAEIYQVASLSSSATGLSLSIANANTSDGGQRASAEIISRSITQGDAGSWSVTGLDAGTVIAQNASENGVASFNQTGKLNGIHRATVAVGLEHQDQSIVGAQTGDLGTLQFAIQQVVSGNLDGGTATVLAGQDYGTISTGFNAVKSGGLQTAATLLDGTAAAQRVVTMSFGVAETFFSDVLTLTGTGSDVFALQMTFIDSPGQEGDMFLGWREPGGPWVNAIGGNIGGTAFDAGNVSYADYIGGFGGVLTAANLGAYGLDETNNVAWAVLNHNSEFAAVVPEPGTTAFPLLVVAAASLRRSRTARQRGNLAA